MKENYRKHFGLIGCPLGHSMSSLIHNELFKISHVNADYELIEVPIQELESLFENKLTKMNGFNVTIPHKINIISFLDELSHKARLFGSVNTVDIKDNKIIGYNTDWIGFTRSIKYANINLEGDVLICGSGGVSRMFVFESILAGADVTIAVRDSGITKAIEIRDEIQKKLSKDCKIISLSEIKCGYDLIINGTPVRNVSKCR